MPETVKVNHDLGIIEVIAVGNVSGADIAGSLKHIAELGDQTGFRKVLVDVTEQTSEPEIAEMYHLVSQLPHGTKFAMVNTSAEQMMETHQFGKTVAANHGLSFELFNSRDNAVAWLQS